MISICEKSELEHLASEHLPRGYKPVRGLHKDKIFYGVVVEDNNGRRTKWELVLSYDKKPYWNRFSGPSIDEKVIFGSNEIADEFYRIAYEHLIKNGKYERLFDDFKFKMDGLYENFLTEYKKIRNVANLFTGFMTLTTVAFILGFQQFSDYIGNPDMAKDAYKVFGLIYVGALYAGSKIFKKEVAKLGETTRKKISREPLIGYYLEQAESSINS